MIFKSLYKFLIMLLILITLILSYGLGGSIRDYLLPNEQNTSIKDLIKQVDGKQCRIWYINNIPSLLQCGNEVITDNKTISNIITKMAQDEFNSLKDKRTELINRILIYNISRYDETNPKYKYLGKVEEFACRLALGDGLIPKVGLCQNDYYHCLTYYICRPNALDCDARLFNEVKPQVIDFMNASYNIDPIIERLIKKLSDNIDLARYREELNSIKSDIRLLINLSDRMMNTRFRIATSRTCSDCYNICFPIIHNTSELYQALNKTKDMEPDLLLNMNNIIESIQLNTPVRLEIYETNLKIKDVFPRYRLLMEKVDDVTNKYNKVIANIVFSNLTKYYQDYRETINLLKNKMDNRNVTDFDYYLDKAKFYEKRLLDNIEHANKLLLELKEMEDMLKGKYFVYITINPNDEDISRRYYDTIKLYTPPILGDNLDIIINKTIDLTDLINNRYKKDDVEPRYFVNIYWVYLNISRYVNLSPDLLRVVLSISTALLLSSLIFILIYIIKTVLTEAKLLRYVFSLYIILVLANLIYAYYSLIPTNINIYKMYNEIKSMNGSIIIEEERLKDCVKNMSYFIKHNDKCTSRDLEIDCKQIEANSLILRTTTDKSSIIILGHPINQIQVYINLNDMDRCKYIISDLERYVENNN